MAIVRLIGLDPGLQKTGWGVIEADGNRLRFVAKGWSRPTAARRWQAACSSSIAA